ncbi:endonuclease V [Streptococcus oralis]
MVIDRENLQVVEEVSFHDESRVPYLPGFLAFRELHLIFRSS